MIVADYQRQVNELETMQRNAQNKIEILAAGQSLLPTTDA
jgi:hypothetical protein